MAYFACAPGWTWSENWHSFRSGDGVGASADFSHLGEKKIDECWTDVVCSKKKKKSWTDVVSEVEVVLVPALTFTI